MDGAREGAPDGALDGTVDGVHAVVRQYYGQELKSSSDLQTSACTASNAPTPAVRTILARVPTEVTEKFYGCGNPLPSGIAGLRVLDLGCGSGRDCYVAAALVGEEGCVTGVDMTGEQLEVANKHKEEWCRQLGYRSTNLHFHRCQIEDLHFLGDGAVDLVISNCVVNLSPNKRAVLAEAHRVLRHGGEMHFADVYSDRRLPQQVRDHAVLLGECLGGALYINDFLSLCRDVGFEAPRQLSAHPITIDNPQLRQLVGDAQFVSITFRLFKLPDGVLESACEDYGQVATYRGTIPDHTHAYSLDEDHTFVAGVSARVCGNTAAMLQQTWLAPHFDVCGTRDTHYGIFRAGTTISGIHSKSSGGETNDCSNGALQAAGVRGGQCCC